MEKTVVLDSTELLFDFLSRGTVKSISDILAQGADVNARDPNSSNRTPLHQAIFFRRNQQIIKILLTAGADVNATDNLEYTPLHVAAIGKNKMVAKYVELLVDAKANPNLKNVNGDTALQLGIAYQQSKDYYKFTKAAEILIEAGADVNTVNNFGNTPLRRAMKNGAEEIKNLLLAAAANSENNVDSVNVVPADTAVNFKVQKASGTTQFHLAVASGNFDQVEQMVDDDVDLEVRDACGSTPLHLSVQCGLQEITLHLLDSGADVDAKNFDGDTPVHIAAAYGDYGMLRILIDYFDAEVNLKNNCGKTALDLALEEGYCRSANFLLNFGATITLDADFDSSGTYEGRFLLNKMVMKNSKSKSYRYKPYIKVKKIN